MLYLELAIILVLVLINSLLAMAEHLRRILDA
jgi:hypothetical protein